MSNAALKKKIEIKLKALKEGQVLDVTNFDDQGNGMKVMTRPATNDRVRHGLPDIPVVSSHEAVYERVVVELLGRAELKGEYEVTKRISQARTPPKSRVSE